MVIGSFPGELRAARGTKSKTGGTSGCELPSDKLTLKQIEAMHGEITSVTLRPGLSWTALCALPEHLQKAYMETMVEHGASSFALADMFDISQTSVYNRLKALGITMPPVPASVARQNRERWDAWCEECEKKKAEKIAELEGKEMAEEKKITTEVTKVGKSMVLKSGRLCLEGEGAEIARLLMEILPGGELEVEVNFHAVME